MRKAIFGGTPNSEEKGRVFDIDIVLDGRFHRL
jgi:hypothetical protein